MKENRLTKQLEVLRDMVKRKVLDKDKALNISEELYRIHNLPDLGPEPKHGNKKNK